LGLVLFFLPRGGFFLSGGSPSSSCRKAEDVFPFPETSFCKPPLFSAGAVVFFFYFQNIFYHSPFRIFILFRDPRLAPPPHENSSSTHRPHHPPPPHPRPGLIKGDHYRKVYPLSHPSVFSCFGGIQCLGFTPPPGGPFPCYVGPWPFSSFVERFFYFFGWAGCGGRVPLFT